MKTAVDVLRDAHALIVEKGWWQGGRTRAVKGTHCAISALTSTGVNESLAEEEAMGLLTEAIGVSTLVDVVDWNDAPGRTVEEVLAAFDRAIEIAEPKQDISSPSLAPALTEQEEALCT